LHPFYFFHRDAPLNVNTLWPEAPPLALAFLDVFEQAVVIMAMAAKSKKAADVFL
jgi:hypothetical protein